MVLHVWNALPVRGWPLSAREEERFVADLTHAAPEGPSPEILRSDITTLMVLLRDGASLSEGLAFLPGIRPDRLLSAYEYLEGLREVSCTAWRKVSADPSAVCLAEHAEQAAILLPVPVHRVSSLTVDGLVQDAHQAAAAAQREVDEVCRNARDIEHLLENGNLTVPQSQALGAKLFDPIFSGIWSNAHYLPRRVTDLSPNRVRLLVGEST